MIMEVRKMKKRLAIILAIVLMMSLMTSCEIEEYEEDERNRDGEGSDDLGVLMTEETGRGYPWDEMFGGYPIYTDTYNPIGTTEVETYGGCESFIEIVSETETRGGTHDETCECGLPAVVTVPPRIDPIVEDTTADPYETAWETTADPEENKFELSYEMSRTKYRRGETVTVTSTVTNVSGENHYYVGSSSEFMAYVSIYYCGNDQIVYSLEHEPIAFDDDYMGQIIEPGESRSVEYVFSIPTDAPTGYYAVRLSYCSESYESNYAIQIFEEDHRIDTEPFSNRTGSCVAGYDGVKVKPLSGFVCESYMADGEDGMGSGYEADGGGAWGIMYEVTTWGDDSFLPEVVWVPQGGDLDFDFGNYEFRGVSIIEVGGAYDDIKHLSSLDELHKLPLDEYYVIISLSSYSSAPDGSWSRSVAYEDVFKLIVDVLDCCEE